MDKIAQETDLQRKGKHNKQMGKATEHGLSLNTYHHTLIQLYTQLTHSSSHTGTECNKDILRYSQQKHLKHIITN